jgi:hypothetical protein
MPLLPCRLSKTIPLFSLLRAKRLVSTGQQQKRRNIPRGLSTSETEVQLTNVRGNVLEVLSLISGGGRRRQGQKSLFAVARWSDLFKAGVLKLLQ